MLDIPCVILAGGKSSRMGGQDKALLPFGGFNSLSEFQVKKFENFFKNVYLSSKTNKFNFDAKLILDESEEYSPMNALLSIFLKFKGYVFISPVDLPFIEEKDIKKLYENISDFDIVVPKDEKNLHSLCGFFHSRLAQKVKMLREKNIHKIKELFKISKTKEVFFNQSKNLVNINFPSDYERALKI